MERRPTDPCFRPRQPSRRRLQRHRPDARRRLGRLPLSQCVDAGRSRRSRRVAAGDGLDSRRRLRRRLGRPSRATTARDLAAKGIVVVTVNHRLNALGFLALPELDRQIGGRRVRRLRAARPRGRVEVGQIQHCRLRGQCGRGDDRRQIGGIDGGQRPHGLAARARPLHPCDRREWIVVRFADAAPEAARRGGNRGRRLLRSASASRTSANCERCPPSSILAAAPGVGFRPIVDGHFLPRTPDEIFIDRAHNHVALMAGWNEDEGFNFTLQQGADADRPYADIVARSLRRPTPPACFTSIPRRRSRGDAAAARELGGDLMIGHSRWTWLEAACGVHRAKVFRFVSIGRR